MSSWLTTSEVANQLRVNRATVARWVKQDKIPKEFICRPSGVNKGSKILISQLALDKLIRNPYSEYEPKKFNSDGYSNTFLKRF